MSQQHQTTQPVDNNGPFRWLFVAFFADGTTIEQTQEDKSTLEPETRSAYYDVYTRNEAQHDLTAFELRSVDGDKAVTVYLESGAFMANGIPMHLHNQAFDPSRRELKLIFFHEKLEHQDFKMTVQEDGSVDRKKVGNPRGEHGRYFIGWETVVNGKNKQVTLAVG